MPICAAFALFVHDDFPTTCKVKFSKNGLDDEFNAGG
jgi:hypothetical protein